MIILFLVVTSLLLLSIIIHCWRKNDSIKTTKKVQAQKISSAGFALTIILFFICVIGDILIGNDFNKANHPCGDYYINGAYIYRNLLDKNSIDCRYYGINSYVEVVTLGEYAISYFCFSYTEIAMIFAMFLWRSSKIRIINEIDGPIPAPQPVIVQQPVVYGAQYPPYDGQMQQQYFLIKEMNSMVKGQYVIQPNMYEGGYCSNQYQQQNATPVQQGGNDNFNVMMKPGINVPFGNSQENLSSRNMK